MMTAKAVPEGLKSIECECDMGVKNTPMQDTLETKWKTTNSS